MTARTKAKRQSSRTIASDVFDELRGDILECRLAPGTRLRFKDLRTRYGSGLSPLREALMRLVADDLVVLEDHKGFRVAPVSQEELVDLAMTWFELEALGIRQSIKKGDDRWAANIQARFRELSKQRMRTTQGTLNPDWEPRNLAFHESLYAACGSPSLMRFCRTLSERFSRYRRLWARGSHQRNIAKEHEDLCRAVLNRDAAAAVATLRMHRTTTIRDLLANWNGS
ncbi:MAG: FCD domain-containing protein [Acidobacteria bacterium]|nr:MAG: FCD domain-containing protein [Acidobacteriota bacterium]